MSQDDGGEGVQDDEGRGGLRMTEKIAGVGLQAGFWSSVIRVLCIYIRVFSVLYSMIHHLKVKSEFKGLERAITKYGEPLSGLVTLLLR